MCSGSFSTMKTAFPRVPLPSSLQDKKEDLFIDQTVKFVARELTPFDLLAVEGYTQLGYYTVSI